MRSFTLLALNVFIIAAPIKTAHAQFAATSSVSVAEPNNSAPPSPVRPDQKPELLPSSLFAAARTLAEPQLSPDGQNIVYRNEVFGKKFMTVKNIVTSRQDRFAEPEDVDLLWYRWVGNRRLLLSAASNVRSNGGEWRVNQLFTYDLITKQFQIAGRKKLYNFYSEEILYFDPDGKFILQSTRANGRDIEPSVFKINMDDNSSELLVKAKYGIYRWTADAAGVVRMGIARHGLNTHVYYRSVADEEFRIIARIPDGAKEDQVEDTILDISHIVSGSDEGYVLSNKQTGRFGLYKFNYATRETGEKIFDHPENDITEFSLDQSGKSLISVRYTDSRDRIFWFDENRKKLQMQLENVIPGQEVWLHDATTDGKKMIVYTTSATDPGSYYLFEPEVKKLHRFGGVNDNIDPAALSETKYTKYTGRDGTVIPAYLTLPRGRDPKNLPLIILPHGGPYGVRDTLDYNAEVQFIASRGYVVLQPNYRGSDSYGKAFYEAGVGQIGRAMQDDLDDGMDWLIKQGMVDPKRVCLVGASYGGYAALWGVIRNPERYRCAASFAGVTDFKKQLSYDRQFFSNRNAREWKNIVRGDAGFNLDDVSPALKLSTLSRPVLLTHGDKDSNVPFSQYNLMVAAAQKANVAIETKVYEGEGHGFSKRENEQDWYDRLEAFLGKHNPAF